MPNGNEDGVLADNQQIRQKKKAHRTGMARWASCLVRDLQLPTAVDNIGFEIV